jgi:hypothetical protein
MKLRQLLLPLGLAAMMNCGKPALKTQDTLPSYTPIVTKSKPKTELKIYHEGYEIIQWHGISDRASYRFTRTEECIDLYFSGKDWVNICAHHGKVFSLENYTTSTTCNFSNNECNGSKQHAQRLFDLWKKRLNVTKYHKRWLEKKRNPLSDWI